MNSVSTHLNVLRPYIAWKIPSLKTVIYRSYLIRCPYLRMPIGVDLGKIVPVYLGLQCSQEAIFYYHAMIKSISWIKQTRCLKVSTWHNPFITEYVSFSILTTSDPWSVSVMVMENTIVPDSMLWQWSIDRGRESVGFLRLPSAP